MIRNVSATLAAVLLTAACSKDPSVAAQRYIESGDRYAKQGKYRFECRPHNWFGERARRVKRARRTAPLK